MHHWALYHSHQLLQSQNKCISCKVYSCCDCALVKALFPLFVSFPTLLWFFKYGHATCSYWIWKEECLSLVYLLDTYHHSRWYRRFEDDFSENCPHQMYWPACDSRFLNSRLRNCKGLDLFERYFLYSKVKSKVCLSIYLFRWYHHILPAYFHKLYSHDIWGKCSILFLTILGCLHHRSECQDCIFYSNDLNSKSIPQWK